MFISIVMSVYNESKNELTKSIMSILNQTYKNFEFIIVIDNPNNFELINLVREFSIMDKRIKYIVNKKNIGLALSLNKGINLSKSEYIVRMDADDISVENRLEKQVNYLFQHPDVSLLGSCARTIDENDKIIRDWRVEVNSKKIIKKMKRENCFIHPTVVFKKEVFKKVGEYRQFPCAQDYDLFLRIIDNNYSIANLSENLLFYRVRSENLTNRKRLLQILLSEYIQQLSKERKKNKGIDSFNMDEIKRREIIFEKDKKNFDKAREIVQKYKSNIFLLSLNTPRIICKSKYYLYLIKNKLKILF